MKRIRTLAAILAMACSAFAIDNAIVQQLKNKLTDHDVAVCLNDTVHVNGQQARHVDNVADGDIDVFMDENGKLTDYDQDTTATYDLLVRVNNPNTFATNAHIIGVDDVADGFNQAFINNLNIPGTHIYKIGLDASEIDHSIEQWFGLEPSVSINPIKSVPRKVEKQSKDGYTLLGRKMQSNDSSGAYVIKSVKVNLR
jgi:hypothetical protein